MNEKQVFPPNHIENLDVVPSSGVTLRIRGFRILIIGDVNREATHVILEREGAVIDCVADVPQAIAWLNIHPKAVDVALMDIQLPQMDGYAAMRLIRETAHWKALPIIALSEAAMNQAAIDAFIIKPFDVEQLISTILYVTHPDLCDSPVLHSNRLEASPLINTTVNYPHIPGVDVEQGLKRWREVSIYQKFLHKFVESYAQAGRQIAAFLRSGDKAAAAALNHKLKGVVGVLALTDFSPLISQLDQNLQAGVSAIEIADQLQQTIDRVCFSIATWLALNDGETQHKSVLKTDADNIAEARRLLDLLLPLLDRDDPDSVAPVLSKLQGLIADQELQQIRGPLDDFDFRGGEVATLALILRLNSLTGLILE